MNRRLLSIAIAIALVLAATAGLLLAASSCLETITARLPAPRVANPTATSQPVFTLRHTIQDDTTGTPIKAAVYVDGRLFFQDVDQFQINIAVGRRVRVRVAAPGYNVWELEYYATAPQTLTGPIRLVPLTKSD